MNFATSKIFSFFTFNFVLVSLMKAISTSSGNSFFIPSMKLFSKTGAAGSSCSGFGGVGF